MNHHFFLFAMSLGAGGAPPLDPFLRRVLTAIEEWIETEWARKESIRTEALTGGWTTERKSRLRDATLTTNRLANHLDGMSEATFRRELEKLGAPPPGELIRKARIRYAAKLLTHTRLLVNKVGKRCGYRSEKHFTDAFRAELKTTPSAYRRSAINQNTDA
ncbi:MAG: helix-turn-helix transcriptional regulator [Proteobacteria bacterium]|nr:helix-turn-helix transcriptional regulator [Pseudomonadota bacterium]